MQQESTRNEEAVWETSQGGDGNRFCVKSEKKDRKEVKSDCKDSERFCQVYIAPNQSIDSKFHCIK